MSKIGSITPGGSPFIDPGRKAVISYKKPPIKKKSDESMALIESIVRELGESPAEVDPQVLATVRKAIAEGKYQVDVEYLAENLINEYFK